MKKVIALFLALLFSASVVACASKNETNNSQTSDKDTEKATQKSDFEIPVFRDLGYEEYNLDEYITLPDYKSYTLEYNKMTVTENDINGYINKLAVEMATKKETDTPSKSGNGVECSYTGTTADGTSVGESKDVIVVIGSGQYLPGFEDALIGLKAGDSKEFSVTLPEDYRQNTALAGQAVTFNVTVSKVYDITIPIIDDNFAQALKIEGVSDLNGLKEYSKSVLQDTADYQNSVYKETALYKRLMAEAAVIKYPERELNFYLQSSDEESAKQNVLSDLITYKLKAIYNLELSKEEFNNSLNFYYEQNAQNYGITNLQDFYNNFGTSVAHGQLQQICLERAAQDIK